MEQNNMQPILLAPVKKAEPPMLVKLRQNYPYFALIAVGISLLLDFCFCGSVYHFSGTAYPLFVAGLIAAIIASLKGLGIPVRKKAGKYLLMIVLFAISTWRTDSGFLHFYNNVAVFMLLAVFLIQQFYQEEKWGIGKYVVNILLLPFRTLGAAYLTFSHFKAFSKEHNWRGQKLIPSILIGIAASIPLLGLILVLLSGADMIFGQMVEEWFAFFTVFKLCKHIFYLSAGYLGFYGLISAFCRNDMDYEEPAGKKREPIPAIVMSAVILVCYLLFCWIQIFYLFGHGESPLPAGVTYAEYARQGFFQLLAIVFINLFFVLMCLYICRENRILKGLLAVISGCTFIMIGSAFYRMLLYVDVYRLTFLRVLVLWFLLLLTPLMGGCLAYILKKGFPLLKFSLTVIMTGYLLFSLARPDYIIAEYNMAKSTQVYVSDIEYLFGLSADAYPTILNAFAAELIVQENNDDFWIFKTAGNRVKYYEHYEDGFKSFNFSRHKIKMEIQQLNELQSELAQQ